MRSKCGCTSLLFVAVVFAGPFRCTQIDLSQALSNDVCSDDFNRADADTVGGNWDPYPNYPQPDQAEIKIVGGKAWFYLPNTSGSRLTAISCKNRVEQSRSKVSVEILSTSMPLVAGHQIILFGRLQDFSNGFACAFKNGNLDLGRAVGGVLTSLGSVSFSTIQQNITAYLTLETIGDNLTCKIEQSGVTKQTSAVDSTFSAGKVALFANSQSATFDFYADNLKVEVVR